MDVRTLVLVSDIGRHAPLARDAIDIKALRYSVLEC